MFASNTSQVSNGATYIEDVFSTWLYAGNGGTQTITNGIDLSTYGGMVWIKNRAAANHAIGDTVALGFGTYLSSNTTAAAAVDNNSFQTFNSNGFTIKQSTLTGASANNYVSWTFRKQPKFFDVVTYTGNGSNSVRNINHNLNAVPGVIIVKPVSASGDWKFSHKDGDILLLNTTDSSLTAATLSGGYPSGGYSTYFQLMPYSGSSSAINANGVQYVAYLFAHNAGGFGLTGTDNVISCGSFTTDASANMSVTLGYEPQWLLIKRTDSSTGGNWYLVDNMRGFPVTSNGYSRLFANTSDAEANGADLVKPSATGFYCDTGAFFANATYIYIAIRRGPMKTPTSGTSVFAPVVAATDNSAITTNFPADFVFEAARSGSAANFYAGSRLTGQGGLITSSTGAELSTAFGSTMWQSNTSVTPAAFGATSLVLEGFRRAPGFFDEVCYSGVNAVQNVSHNLGVAPELMIVKRRNSTGNWFTYAAPLGATNYLLVDSTAASAASSLYWNNTDPTSSVFTVANNSGVNASGNTYVAYLFASCPGVSKVGSYTGDGAASQTINCGFTSGARFILLKSTSDASGWLVFDSARGIVVGNDPFLALNSTAAENNVNNLVETDPSGFKVINNGFWNAAGKTFIFLAIA